jgi:sugar phosphate isomerase/epimerase
MTTSEPDSPSPVPRPIAVQLWSVRDLAERDVAGVLRAIANIGYLGVEPFGLHGLRPSRLRGIIDDLGLEIGSAHAPFPAGSDAERILDEQQELGAPAIAWSLEPEEFESEELIARGAERVNEGVANAARRGIRVAYHNHQAEFARSFGGRTAYELLLDHLSPETLIELDIYWTRLGGDEPARVARDLGSRLRFLHVKDGPVTSPNDSMVAVGRGRLDIPAVLNANPSVAWHIVELDRCDGPIIDALNDSYAYLVGNGLSTGRTPISSLN